ncbi:styrene monooxygenase/indole monooxygenase family protein [Streptomyces stelliscabiei]|uniref:styrene monooxygenase/indole monooxygenase family protein n=1 Tax=Streptomyces stelliscabiei TaxID=146820 RepID=UPI0029B1DCF5|nr:styrene monooxygenase/indole monooxygenase family protein [Streptomyces stelliscabiei]MDX2557041.1 FAD-binding oxidoreductase [Streptomyces stelliscabiei]MDX2616215.1 FAD-binding oxidoreductase [Streptomyces stelliscabiei]MDX2640916.1 FAD-binding oxidoreductase [Streptomyces stelliscabiei]MDX2664978.1 FAD-binding oxidoreductase [Streptomyces stelliscabiei]MDX2716096.1 FAD-binding oxidoreductase [Streptomyces stelliscabiei]
MRKILVVGAGQSGLHLALGLQSHGYEVTLMSNRTPDEIRAGRIMSTQCMFDSALRHERDLDLNFWESQAPRIEGVGVSVAGPDGERAVDWVGRLRGYAQAVDQRVKMAGWLETFARRGGQLVVHGAAVSDLDWFSRAYDLVLVTAGKGELVRMFPRDAARSPHTEPQRALAAVYVHGLGPRPEHPEFDAARCNLVPGLGELIVQPVLTTSGRADALFWLGLPGGPLDVFDGVCGAEEQLALTLDLMKRYVPWEYARAAGAEVTDAGAALTGRYTPVVRHPVAELPGGGLVLGAGDVVVANDPLTGQGANSATKCAAVYLAAILDHGDGDFDEAWMRRTFARFWQVAGPVTKWTNTMLAPPAEHVRGLVGAAEALPVVADRFANGFDDPADFEGYFYEAEKTRAYLAEVAGS